ncbi:MAG: hypothetical protein AABY22_14500 [Nanoarchaeota archaeon]
MINQDDGLDNAIELMQNVKYSKNQSKITQNLNKTLAYICTVFECTKTELINLRTPEVLQARKSAYIILRNEFDMHLDDISVIFKNSLSLVSKTTSTFFNEIEKDIDLKIKYELIKKKVKELKADAEKPVNSNK